MILSDNKVLLIRNKGEKLYKFPGGHVNDQESIRESAVRKTKEELGIVVEVSGDPYFYLFEFDDNTDIVLVNYRAEIVKHKPRVNADIEEIKWFDVDGLPENIFDNVVPVIKHFNLNVD